MHLRQSLRTLFDLPSRLLELISLLREQNSLMRELIQFHTRRPAQTPYSQAAPLRLIPPPSITPRTAADVFAVSTTRRQEIQREMEQKLTAPWRVDEHLPAPEPFHPSQMAIPTPNRTDQPLPSGSASTQASSGGQAS